MKKVSQNLKERFVKVDQICLDFSKWCYIFSSRSDLNALEVEKNIDKTWVDVKSHEKLKKRT